MTKDRRLGRGLAALLGSPLDGDDVVDGAVAAPSTVTADRADRLRADGKAIQSSSEAKPNNDKNAKPAASVTSNISASPNQTVNPTSAAAPVSSTSVSTSSRPAATTNRSSSSKARVKQPSSPAAGVTGSVPLNGKSEQTVGAALELSVYEIDNNPFQPRRKFNDDEIASLAESIRAHQQLQPILVRKVGERFQLISGERRLRATIHAGLTTIRAEVREADDRLVAELAIVENLQRKDLDPIEKALSFRRYIDQHRCKQEDLAKRLKIDRSTIANLMRLLELPEAIQQGIQAGRLTAGHARALLPLGEESQQMDFAKQIENDSWSVRETERRVAEQLALEDGDTPAGGGSKPPRKRTSPQLASLEQQLRLSLGTKAEIRQSASGRGKIIIGFANGDEFDRIMALICPNMDRKAA